MRLPLLFSFKGSSRRHFVSSSSSSSSSSSNSASLHFEGNDDYTTRGDQEVCGVPGERYSLPAVAYGSTKAFQATDYHGAYEWMFISPVVDDNDRNCHGF
jgi:hypothetical protein